MQRIFKRQFVTSRNGLEIKPANLYNQTITLSNGATLEWLTMTPLKPRVLLVSDSTNHFSYIPSLKDGGFNSAASSVTAFNERFGISTEDILEFDDL
jgi:hypothetical protein